MDEYAYRDPDASALGDAICRHRCVCTQEGRLQTPVCLYTGTCLQTQTYHRHPYRSVRTDNTGLLLTNNLYVH